METSEQSAQTAPGEAYQPAPASPVDAGAQKPKGWSEKNKAVIICTIITAGVAFVCQGLVVVAGMIAKDREQARTKEIEIAKIQKDAEVKQAQMLQQQAYETGVRQEGFRRMEQQQSATQRQRLLAFYSAILGKLEQADGVWWKRPTQQEDAVLIRFDRTQLLPIYAEVQKLISENGDLVPIYPKMREEIAEFGRRVATFDYSHYNGNSPHGNLRYLLQWVVPAMSQQDQQNRQQ